MPKILETRAKHFLRLWVVLLQDITDEVRRQAEQRTSSRFHHVTSLFFFDLALKITRRSRRCANLKKKKTMTWIPRTSTIAERPWSVYRADEQCQKRHARTRIHRNPTWKNLTEKTKRKGRITSLLLQKTGFTTEINTRSYNPTKEEAATP